jgi:hypothetical protein
MREIVIDTETTGLENHTVRLAFLSRLKFGLSRSLFVQQRRETKMMAPYLGVIVLHNSRVIVARQQCHQRRRSLGAFVGTALVRPSHKSPRLPILPIAVRNDQMAKASPVGKSRCKDAELA